MDTRRYFMLAKAALTVGLVACVIFVVSSVCYFRFGILTEETITRLYLLCGVVIWLAILIILRHARTTPPDEK